MQVLNGGDFEQNNVIIGGGETEAFGVTNDPVLMGMLSTGLYQKPMRTMIQENLFNAWDAHRMGKCLDTPIDVYLNDTSGLIIRDYGPGIHKKEIHPIYCIYGNSTKRQNDELTGGFGLGSKSPYAYTDSFTVTSHHDGRKGMYIMNRVSEKNSGGPGRTILFEDIPTEETGLIVTIPLKNESDLFRAYEYIKDVLYLSGIKARIHFQNKEPELIESEAIAPGEWIVAENQSRGDLYAVYGGVRYELIEDEAYSEEYQFVKKMARMLGTMYIGFKPSTLTPLPSREGLNLNERTVETIKNQFEVMEEHFRELLIPVTRTVLLETFKVFLTSGIEPKYLIKSWVQVGNNKNLKEIICDDKIVNTAQEQAPDSINQSMWKSVCILVFNRTLDMEKMLGSEKMNLLKYIIWAKNFPEHRHYKNYLMHYNSLTTHVKTPSAIEIPLSSKDLIDAKNIVDQITGQTNDMRVNYEDQWLIVENRRRAGKLSSKTLDYRAQEVLKVLGQNEDFVPKLPQREYPDRLWYKRDGIECTKIWLTKTIIVAKNLSALKDTPFAWQKMFTANYPTVSTHHPFHHSRFGDRYFPNNERPVPALIINDRKGSYQQAVEALKEAGYTVYEADEPIKRTYVPKTPGEPVTKNIPTYPLYDPSAQDWANWHDAVDNPTCYLTITEHMIKNNYSSNMPDRRILAWVAQNTPRFVIIHNKSRITKKFDKIPNFTEMVDHLVNKLLSDEERVRKMMLHSIFETESNLSAELRALPEVQKFFQVPYLRNSQKETFQRDMLILKTIKNMYRHNHWITPHTIDSVQIAFKAAESDTSVSLVREISQKTNLIDEKGIREYLRGKKPGEIKVFSEKLMRFLRTV